MRQHLNAKKVAALARETGLDVVYVLVRGGTDHRRDLCLRDGSIINLWSDGSTTESDMRHGIQQEEYLR